MTVTFCFIRELTEYPEHEIEIWTTVCDEIAFLGFQIDRPIMSLNQSEVLTNENSQSNWKLALDFGVLVMLQVIW